MKKIKGGKKGFIEAVDEAFMSNMSDPMVKYSPSRGFHCESRHTPSDSDVVWRQLAFYNLNCNGERSMLPRDYHDIRLEIIEELEQMDNITDKEVE